MATTEVTPLRPRASAGDQFENIWDRMQAQLDALRCVLALFDSEVIEGDENLIAARGLFHRTFHELDRLHGELETWHMSPLSAKPSKARP